MSQCKQEHFTSQGNSDTLGAKLNEFQTSFCKATAKEKCIGGVGSTGEATRGL